MPIRTPAQIRSEGNRLASERSLYLQQHAHNPIDWYPWGPEALGRASAEDKPLFLSIGYASCHWCHVMEHEVFEHDEVAAFMNEHFVCIKVDREERPDLDAVYMEAVQMLSGGGGWPMSVFLTPSLQPFFGATYIPRDRFLSLAARIHEVFLHRRDELEQQAKAVSSAIAAEQASMSEAVLDAALIDQVAQQGWELFDETYGGFRARMKFPTPLRWAFLLHHFRKNGDEASGRKLRQTLDAMLSGGLRDHVGGGFHRYTVDPTWLVPHFEKMLYDNAQLASLYLEASYVFASDKYAEVARDTLQFMLREMLEPGGALCASFDADSGGHEGSFYVWTPAELQQVAGPDDGPVLAALLGATHEGNFEGSNVLTRTAEPRQVASRFGRSPQEVEAMFERWRPALLQARSKRTAPGRDGKVVASWNGLAIAAFSQAHGVLGDDEWLHAARRAADYLWSVHRREDGLLLRASNDGVPTGHGVLDDYAFLAWGLLELHQASGEALHAERARWLIDQAIEQFSLPAGGFYFTGKSTDAPLGRKELTGDAVEPSGQAVMLQCMLRLAALTGERSYLALVEDGLRAHAHLMRAAGMEMAWWADAALRLRGPYHEVVVAGDEPGLARAVLQSWPPHAALLRVGPAGPEEETAARFPPTAGKVARGGVSTAYVCQFGSCQAPTTDAAALMRQLMEGWSR
jgi:hypothetical protein